MIQLQENETILELRRRHWLVFVAEAFFPALLMLLPVGVVLAALSGVLPLESLAHHIDGSVWALLFFLSAVWLLVMWMILFVIWTEYYLDFWVVTNRRVIHVHQKSLFRRTVSSFRLDRIQDLTIEVKGIVYTLLRIGDIHVQTAGASREFIIRGIPRPREFKDKIYTQHTQSLDRFTHPDATI
jgi:uncharacterized membrane protein YdbT with pleckstrin-like domain